jgi:hypothetical protein
MKSGMLAEMPREAERTYLLEQRFRYTYATPVRHLHHRLVVVPRASHGGQYRLDHGLKVSGSPVLVSVKSDSFGNHVVELRANAVDEWIEFDAWAVVGRRGPGGVTTMQASAVGERRLLSPTPLTVAEHTLADAARELADGGADALDLAERACSWAHRALTYEFGVTGVRTSAAAAVAAGRGVCQDYAHVMLALCRAAGVPARYVSGHLVGEGGSHAWVEVVVSAPSAGGSDRVVRSDPRPPSRPRLPHRRDRPRLRGRRADVGHLRRRRPQCALRHEAPQPGRCRIGIDVRERGRGATEVLEVHSAMNASWCGG